MMHAQIFIFRLGSANLVRKMKVERKYVVIVLSHVHSRRVARSALTIRAYAYPSQRNINY